MEGGSNGGGKINKESISIFVFYKPFVLSVLVDVSCVLHWPVFV